MLIRCPQCSTGFNLAEDKIPEKGAKVKCSACTHTFRVKIEDGEPSYFYKRGEAPTGQTMVGTPLDVEKLGITPPVDSDQSSTQFGGLPSRSKSSKAGYDPFPLAGLTTSEDDARAQKNGSTQILGSTEAVDDADRNSRTQLGPTGLAEESAGERTQLGRATSPGVKSKKSPPPLRTAEDDRNDRTQAFGSGAAVSSDGIDLFENEDLPDDDGPPPIDIDPFDSAFDEPVGDVGLLMPSTPFTEDPVPEPMGLGLESSSEMGLSEADFLRGGGHSSFGDASSLVDPSFADDVPAFDVDAGVVDFEKRSSPGRRPKTGRHQPLRTSNKIELEDVREAPKKREATPAPVSRAPEPVRTSEVERAPARPSRPAPAYVHELGAASPMRRTLDVIFITLVVVAGFLGLIAARAGGFIDFSRFGHMVEVAFSGEDFVPREEWKTVVEIPPPDPPPDEPLRIENLRAVQKPVGDEQLLVVTGKIRNYSLKSFKSVEVRGTVTKGDDVLSTRLEKAGKQLDLKKFGKATTTDEVKSAVVSKLPDVGKEGTTYFTLVFDDVPSKVVEQGQYDYNVEVAE